MPKIARITEMAINLPHLIQSLIGSHDNYHMNNIVEKPNVTEKVRQLFQRVEMQDSICLDFVRNLVTTYGSATALLLQENSSDRKLITDAAEAIERNLMRAFGVRKTELIFELLASIVRRLRSLHIGAHSMADSSQKVNHSDLLFELITLTNIGNRTLLCE